MALDDDAPGSGRPLPGSEKFFRHSTTAVHCVCDLGADIGSRRWLAGVTGLLSLIGSTLALGVLAGSGGLSAPAHSEMPPATARNSVISATDAATAFPLPARFGDLVRPARLPLESPLAAPPAPSGTLRPVPLPRPKILPPSAAPGQPAAAEASDKVETRIVALRRGDTLAGVLSREGVARADIHAVVMALKPYYDPRHLRVGQDVEVTLASHDAATGTAAATHLLRVAISPDIERALRAERRDDGGFAIEEVVTPLQASMVRVAGEIRSNVYLALAKAGMPSELILGLIQMFSYTVDFQRDIQPGDRFEILYETFYDQDGRAVRTGEIQFGRLILGGKEFRLYRYVTDDGGVGYYDAEGRSNRKALMRTPIDGARLSSGFGMRRHPVLGYSRMHRGVDFAAPQGTPIMAAGDGVVEFVGRKSGYGNFIKLRHFAGYSTGYAHLSRFAKTIQNGAKVRQGDIIGYVGSTGLATGPHLHFEVFRNGNQIDPASADLPEHQLLAGAEREKFASRRAVLERQIAQTPLLRALAQATESE